MKLRIIESNRRKFDGILEGNDILDIIGIISQKSRIKYSELRAFCESDGNGSMWYTIYRRNRKVAMLKPV